MRQVAGLAALGVPEKRLASPVCHSVDFGTTKMRFQRYTVDVCVIFTSFYCENRFLTPSERASFSVPLLRLWDENDHFRVVGISCPKSILTDPVHAKSTSPKKYKIAKRISLEPVHVSSILGGILPPKKYWKTIPRPHRLERNEFSKFVFFEKSILNRQGVSRSTSSTQSRVPEKSRLHPKV